MKKIPLRYKGNDAAMYALVDDSDFKRLIRYKWSAIKGGKTYYAVRSEKAGKNKWLKIRMHREILGLLKSANIIDHADGNGCNNQKKNLRVCSFGENQRNSRVRSDNKSGYKGVCWKHGRWAASIRNGGSPIHLGYFDTAKEAGIAYNTAAIKYHGEFARLNKID